MEEIEKFFVNEYHLNYDSKGILCPFHNDSHGGSFRVSELDGKVVYHCFACGASGSQYNFRINLAEIQGTITSEEKELLLSNKTAKDKKAEIFKKLKDMPTYTLSKKEVEVSKYEKNPQTMDIIYEQILNTLTLSVEDSKYLESRGLSKEEIEFNRYRTLSFFGNQKIMDTINILINIGVFHKRHILGVPGFFEENGKLNFFKGNGIIIPLIFEGKIKALQLRMKDSNSNSKYCFISSSKKGFNSSNAPICNLGTLDKEKSLLITEGHFKMLSLHNLMKDKYNVISMQGIGNSSNILDILEELDNKDLLIAFDKDLFTFNDNKISFSSKAQNIHKWINAIIEKYPNINIEMLMWDKDEKGIDDALNNYSITDIHFNKIKYQNIIK